jgi:hypothetical protein
MKHYWDYYANFIQATAPFSGYNAGTNTPSTANMQLRNINSVSMPSKIIVWCDKMDSNYNANQAKYFYPIINISLDLGTKQNLLSNYQIQDLYRLSLEAGLKSTSYLSFIGGAYALKFTSLGVIAAATPGANVQLVSSPDVLIPGISFPLPADVATGSVGNFTFNFNVTCQTNNASDATGAAVVTPYLNVLFVYDKWLKIDTSTLKVSSEMADITPSEVLGSSRAETVVEAKDEVDELEGGLMAHHERKKNPLSHNALHSYKSPAKLSSRVKHH